jgi:HSP20 family protein
LQIDDTIQKLEGLYRTLTGAEPPSTDQPFAPIPPEKDAAQHVSEQMDRLIALFSAGPAIFAAQPPVAPPLAIWETPEQVIVQLDVPGLSAEALEVTLTSGFLVVSGIRGPTPVNGDGERRIRAEERRYGVLRRLVPLPVPVSGEPEAKLRDGVLEVRLRRDAAPVKTISVR